jgi:hypothetical protein
MNQSQESKKAENAFFALIPSAPKIILPRLGPPLQREENQKRKNNPKEGGNKTVHNAPPKDEIAQSAITDPQVQNQALGTGSKRDSDSAQEKAAYPWAEKLTRAQTPSAYKKEVQGLFQTASAQLAEAKKNKVMRDPPKASQFFMSQIFLIISLMRVLQISLGTLSGHS